MNISSASHCEERLPLYLPKKYMGVAQSTHESSFRAFLLCSEYLFCSPPMGSMGSVLERSEEKTCSSPAKLD